jgi:hypothetical protein
MNLSLLVTALLVEDLPKSKSVKVAAKRQDSANG